VTVSSTGRFAIVAVDLNNTGLCIENDLPPAAVKLTEFAWFNSGPLKPRWSAVVEAVHTCVGARALKYVGADAAHTHTMHVTFLGNVELPDEYQDARFFASQAYAPAPSDRGGYLGTCSNPR
jgi:hypothetical protein